MSILCGETHFLNDGMYNKSYELTGQNCICIEEHTITFFSTIRKGPGSNCCQFNSKSITLFPSNPIFSFFSILRRAYILSKHLCPLTLTETTLPKIKTTKGKKKHK